MNLYLDGDKVIRGDLIDSIILRSDLAPVPLTLECSLRVDAEYQKKLAVGKKIFLDNQDDYEIVKVIQMDAKAVQGGLPLSQIKVIATIASCTPIIYIRKYALIKINATLGAIYRAAGATLKKIDGDFNIPRFICLVGQTPSFGIAQALQHESGVVRIKNKIMTFKRLNELLEQKTIITLPDNNSENISSEFLTRYEVPGFLSINDDGNFSYGNRNHTRTVKFIPHTDVGRLYNMTKYLMRRKVLNTTYNLSLSAGDRVNIVDNDPLIIITAAHKWTLSEQITRLWLGSIENG